jgi:hypothetical protein
MRAFKLGLYLFPVVLGGTDDKDRAEVPQSSVYLARDEVQTRAPVGEDVFLAGAHVTLNEKVTGSANLAGAAVDVNARIDENLRAAGRNVTVTGRIGGSATLLGGNVRLQPFSEVGEQTWIAAASASVAGNIGSDLKVYARQISIGGEIAGDARLIGEDIEILPSARIKGDLVYTSTKEIQIDPAAQIGGAITRIPKSDRYLFGGHSLFSNFKLRYGFSAAFAMGLFGAGTIVLLLFPNFTVAAQAAVASDPLKSLALGFLLFFTIPVMGLMLFISVLGIPLSLALFALYGLLLLLGMLTFAFFLAEKSARLFQAQGEISAGWRIVSLAFALLLLGLIRVIPFIGGLLLFIALLTGIGAWCLQAFRHHGTVRRP